MSASATTLAATHHHDKVAIITGATGNVAPHVISELTKQGFHIIACSRREHEAGPDNVTWLRTSGDDISRKEFWDDVLQEHALGASNVLVVSTIGTARARGDATLEEVNRRMVIPITEAAAEFAEWYDDANVTATHISSLAAQIIPDDEYGRVKLAVDEDIVRIGNEGPENFHAVVFEPGYIFPGAEDLGEGRYRIDDGHAWSMGQIVQLGAVPRYVPYLGGKTICPLAGSGEQIQQPVSVTNLAQAIVNASKPEFTESEIVKAVGPEQMTQAEVIDFYARLSGREAVHVSVPAEFIAAATHHYGYGRLEDFSAKMMKALDENNQAFDTAPFVKYIRDDNPEGTPHIALRFAYPDPNDPNVREITMRPPPIAEHVARVAEIIQHHPTSVPKCVADVAIAVARKFPFLTAGAVLALASRI